MTKADREKLARAIANSTILIATAWAAHHWPLETIAVSIQMIIFQATRINEKMKVDA